ncbi:MAG: NUDIX domain-containing protein [Dehalococcoidales bacterium]|nr:MAG: NUDIX domain-containing protein [Dehalococcoidales bacterium]
MQPRQKVQCYITREHSESLQVLVFEHVDYPEAGVQVPAGSIEPGETAEEAALREAWEESGIRELRVQRYIGKFHWWHAERREDHERHVFQLTTPQTLPERWEHTVSAGAEDKGIRFTCYWLDCAVAVQVLSGNQGDYLQYLESP